MFPIPVVFPSKIETTSINNRPKKKKKQSLRAEVKAKTEALSTNERQRGQYEAMAKAKQQQLDQLTAVGRADKDGLEAKLKEALAKVEAAEGELCGALEL